MDFPTIATAIELLVVAIFLYSFLCPPPKKGGKVEKVMGNVINGFTLIVWVIGIPAFLIWLAGVMMSIRVR
jgi:hypothetical protein